MNEKFSQSCTTKAHIFVLSSLNGLQLDIFTSWQNKTLKNKLKASSEHLFKGLIFSRK